MPGVSHSRALVCPYGSRDGVQGCQREAKRGAGAKRRGILPIWRISPDSMERAVLVSLCHSIPLSSFVIRIWPLLVSIFLYYVPSMLDILPVSIYRSTAFLVSIPIANVNIEDAV